MALIATIGDVAAPGWLALGYEFNYCACINVTAADAIVWSPVFTYEADVAGLAFVNVDRSDRRVLYYNGSTFEEIDSDIRDIGMGLRVYFPAQKNLGAGASDTTSYWLFWNSATAVATKTNRDNIYLLWDECNTKTGWNDYYGTFASAGGRFTNTVASLLDRTLKDIELPTPDVTVYGLVNRMAQSYAFIAIRGDITGNGDTWILGIYAVPAQGFMRQYWIDNTNPVGFRGSVPFVANANTDYVVKCKMVGNNFDGWVAEAGTPIAGAAMINWVDAQANNARYAGFGTVTNGVTTEFDNLYVIHAVTNEPVVALGATEDVADLMPKNIAADLREPRKMVAAITAIEGITGVLGE